MPGVSVDIKSVRTKPLYVVPVKASRFHVVSGLRNRHFNIVSLAWRSCVFFRIASAWRPGSYSDNEAHHHASSCRIQKKSRQPANASRQANKLGIVRTDFTVRFSMGRMGRIDSLCCTSAFLAQMCVGANGVKLSVLYAKIPQFSEHQRCVV